MVHTVIDSSYFNRPESGFFTVSDLARMNAKVGGGRSRSKSKKSKKTKSKRKQKGGTVMDSSYFGRPLYGFVSKGGSRSKSKSKKNRSQSQKKKRRGGSMLNQNMEQERVNGIIENMKYVSKSSTQDILEILQNERDSDGKKYGLNKAKQLLNQYNQYHQSGGNAISLPLSYFNGQIPNPIHVPPKVDNYCEYK